jgi:PST family polysaccharide transporter
MKPAPSISSRALSAVRWNYLGTVGRIAAQFISQILLARLLGPEPTGVFTYAVLVVGLCSLVVEMGLGAGLVQARELDEREIGVVCSRLLLIGVALAAVVYLAADAIAGAVFAAPQAAPVIRAVAPMLLISAAVYPASALLRRDLHFGLVQGAEVGSYVFGYLIVGVGCAFAGLGVWSLVFAWYAQSASACLAMIVFAPRRPRLGNPLGQLVMTRFGVVIMFTNLLNWAIEQGTHVAVGRFFGATALGQFTMSNNLVRTPANHLVVNLLSVLFPMAARAQHNDAGLQRAYLTALAGVGLVAFPVFAFVAIMAGPLVLVLLGPAWAGAAHVLAPLATAMIPHTAMAICGPVLNGRGEPEVELRMQALTLTLMAVVLAATSQASVAVMAWGLLFVYVCRCASITITLVRRLHIARGALLSAVRGPLLLTAAVVAAALGAEPLAHALGLAFTPAVALAIAVGCAAIAVAALVTVAPLLVLGPQLLSLIDLFLQSRPVAANWPGLRRIAQRAERATG